MSLTENGLSAADVAAVTRNNGGGFMGGYGDGGFFWIIILFLFAIFGNNGWGGAGGGSVPYLLNQTNNDVQRVVDQQSVMNGINNLASSTAQGFANAEVSRCNCQTNILQTLNNNQAAVSAGFTGVNAGLADLKYTVATENCADRNQLQESTRDIIDNTNNRYQQIIDKLCQLEIDNIKQNYEGQLRAQNQEISTLQSQLQTARFNASQGAQTASLLADNAAQTYALEQYLNPTPKPAYIVANPNCCQQNYGGCCGSRLIG